MQRMSMVHGAATKRNQLTASHVRATAMASVGSVVWAVFGLALLCAPYSRNGGHRIQTRYRPDRSQVSDQLEGLAVDRQSSKPWMLTSLRLCTAAALAGPSLLLARGCPSAASSPSMDTVMTVHGVRHKI